MTEQTNEAPQAMSLEAMEAAANFIPQEEEKPAEQEEQQEEQQEEHTEEEQQEEEQEAAGEQEQEAEKEEEKPKKRKYIPVDRHENIMNNLRAELDAERKQAAKDREKFQEMLNKHFPVAQAEEEEEEPLDTYTYKKVQELELKNQARDFQSALVQADMVGNANIPNYSESVDYLIASEASKYIARATAIGEKMSNEDAVAAAVNDIGRDMHALYQKSNNPAALAKYTVERARLAGFTPKQVQKKPAGVNMEAVDKARKEAGAPAIKKQPVDVGGSAWYDSIKSDTAGLSKDYLRAMGIGS